MLSEIFCICIVCIIFTFIYVIKMERRRKQLNYPPHGYEFPFIGSLIQLLLTAGTSGVHCDRIHELNKKYGKIGFLKLGALNVVFTQDYETVKEVLTSPDWIQRFPSHPRFKEHTLFQNLGLMWSDGEPHREIRKFTTRALRNFGFGELKVAEEYLQNEIDDFFQMIDNQRVKNSDEVYAQHMFKIPVFNMLWRVMASDRFNYGDPKILSLIHAVDDIAGINVGLDPEWAFPFLRFIPGCSPSRAKRPSFVICHDFFIDILKKRREQGLYKIIQSDFIDVFLKRIDEEKDNPNSFYTDDQFSVTCVDLLFGGLDTTSNSLEFGILYMIKFPEVQRKVQEEIDRVIGSDRTPSVTDRGNLKYTEAVLLETLRFANVVPMNGRTAICDTRIGDYNVEKDTLCGLNITMVHKSNELWDDPDEFKPERFLDEDNNIVNSEKVLAFGGGKRVCPGYAMGKVIFLSFFSSLLQRYNFHPSPKHPEISLIPNAGVANSPKPYYCVITSRN